MAAVQHLAREEEPFSWQVPTAAASLAERALRGALGALRADGVEVAGRPGRFAVALRRALAREADPPDSLAQWLTEAGPALRSLVEARAVSLALAWWLALDRSGVPLAQAAPGARVDGQVHAGRARVASQPLLCSAGDQRWGPTSFRALVLTRDRPPGSAQRLGGLVALVEGVSTGERVPSVVWVVQPEEGWTEAVSATSNRLEEAVAELGAVLGALLDGGRSVAALPARPSSLCRWCPYREACPEASRVPWRSQAVAPPAVAEWLGAEGENLSTSVDYASDSE